MPPSARTISGPHNWLPAAGLVLLALAIRGGVLWAWQAKLAADPDAYRQIAENLLQQGVFALKRGNAEGALVPTAYRPPLYPWLLSHLPAGDGLHVSLTKVALLHVLLGLATVWLTWLTARQMLDDKAGQRAAAEGSGLRDGNEMLAPPLAAGLIVACDPILLHQQALVMTETLATFLAILVLGCLVRMDGRGEQRFWAALAGVALGLAVLCRPTFLPWLGLVAAALMLVPRSGGRMRAWGETNGQPQSDRHAASAPLAKRGLDVALLLASALLVISPWAIRNYRLFGQPILTTTHGGYTLYLANNPAFYAFLRTDRSGLPWSAEALADDEKSADLLRQPVAGPEDELQADAALAAAAWRTIARDRVGFVRAAFFRLRQLWSPLPYRLSPQESTARWLLRYATAAWYSGIYGLAALGIWHLRGRLLAPPWLFGVLLCLTFTAVHVFYWTNLRMRAPLVPVVALVAAAGLAATIRARSAPAPGSAPSKPLPPPLPSAESSP